MNNFTKEELPEYCSEKCEKDSLFISKIGEIIMTNLTPYQQVELIRFNYCRHV